MRFLVSILAKRRGTTSQEILFQEQKEEHEGRVRQQTSRGMYEGISQVRGSKVPTYSHGRSIKIRGGNSQKGSGDDFSIGEGNLTSVSGALRSLRIAGPISVETLFLAINAADGYPNRFCMQADGNTLVNCLGHKLGEDIRTWFSVELSRTWLFDDWQFLRNVEPTFCDLPLEMVPNPESGIEIRAKSSTDFISFEAFRVAHDSYIFWGPTAFGRFLKQRGWLRRPKILFPKRHLPSLSELLLEVQKIDDVSRLKRTAREHPLFSVRCAAVERIDDQEALRRIAVEDPHLKVRLAAVARVSSVADLSVIGTFDISYCVRTSAESRISKLTE